MKEVIARCNWLIYNCNDRWFTPDVKDDITYLLEEIERLNNIIDKQDRDIVALSNGNRKLKTRTDKAIEYIEQVFKRNEDGEDNIWIFDFGNILSILKGDNNE